MSYFVLGIAGPAGSGKDTLANYILRNRANAVKRSFAYPMKRMLAVGLGLTEPQLNGDLKEKIDDVYGVSPRHMLQTLGTEWGRTLVSQDIWVHALAQMVRKQHYKSGTQLFIIPDVRFENEAAYCRKHGAIVHIRGRRKDLGNAAGHISETGVAVDESRDFFIDNDVVIKTFHDYIEQLLSNLGV